ncbi:hypothetical protein [Rugamonas rivuli]|nr:hypothetical protein [Rugamonas rivuli]
MSALTLYYDGHCGFARNRYRISGWLGHPACADGVCAYKHPLR